VRVTMSLLVKLHKRLYVLKDSTVNSESCARGKNVGKFVFFPLFLNVRAMVSYKITVHFPPFFKSFLSHKFKEIKR